MIEGEDVTKGHDAGSATGLGFSPGVGNVDQK
jgi:hypothetical protein